MATYFHVNSEIQPGDHGGMQTLYLMNPNYIPYSDTTSLSNNTLLLNPVNFSHAPPPPPSNDHHHPLVGIPLPAPPSDDNNINRSSSFHYDLWSSIDTHMASLAPASNSSAPLGLSRPVASVPSRQQGLSLSLSSQQVAAYNRPIDHHHNHTELMRVSDSSPSSVTVVSSGISSMQSSILGSKYLRATQEILDEVVKVDQIIIKTDHSVEENKKLIRDSNMTAVDHDEEPNGTNRPYDLTTAQRQELQTKKAKLVNMLDEVEQRYKQYHHQIQLVVSAFEQAAGIRSAKSYTAVALRTISKQFRCLKDAITGQLKETSKKLGEDDCLGAKAESSRLRFVDQLRQQRGLQQLGMMQHQAWRPQRGLPERAVTILRAWLFEHFLHPYPKDSDKQQLAKQTGLTRSQVSNWFINARVRLWKPMVEEMYLEEVKEQERNGSGSTSKTESKESHHDHLEQIKGLQAKAEKSITHIIASPTELSNSTISTSPMGGTLQQQNSFNLIGPSDLEGFVQRRQKKPRNAEMLLNSPSSILSIDMEMKQGETSREIGRERHSVNDLGGGFCTYLMESDMGRFNPVHHQQQQQQHHHHQLDGPAFHGNNGVSLTLGLPHGENLSLSGTQHNLLSGQNVDHLGSGLELGSSTNEPDFCPDSTGYESIVIQNRKGFAAQLLPDFMT